jgi:hypothetical protein
MSSLNRAASCSNIIVIATALIVGAIVGRPARARAEVMCPDTIEVKQDAAAAGDWQVRDSGEKPALERVTIYEGPPNEQVSLKYDRELKRKSELVLFWNLPPSKEGYWLECGYTNTSKMFYRKLPAMTAVCEAIYDRNLKFPDGSPVVRRVRCHAK